MNGLLEIKYPVNNDKLSGSRVHKGEFLGIKDADGNTIMTTRRYSFDGKNYAERRAKALSFTCALVDLLNEHIGKEGAMTI